MSIKSYDAVQMAARINSVITEVETFRNTETAGMIKELVRGIRNWDNDPGTVGDRLGKLLKENPEACITVAGWGLTIFSYASQTTKEIKRSDRSKNRSNRNRSARRRALRVVKGPDTKERLTTLLSAHEESNKNKALAEETLTRIFEGNFTVAQLRQEGVFTPNVLEGIAKLGQQIMDEDNARLEEEMIAAMDFSTMAQDLYLNSKGHWAYNRDDLMSFMVKTTLGNRESLPHEQRDYLDRLDSAMSSGSNSEVTEVMQEMIASDDGPSNEWAQEAILRCGA